MSFRLSFVTIPLKQDFLFYRKTGIFIFRLDSCFFLEIFVFLNTNIFLPIKTTPRCFGEPVHFY